MFSTEKLQKGLDNLRKLYGNFGYIDFVPSPDPEAVPGKDQIDLTIDVDEGHQFFVRRIDFQGNTTTRDRVIRRELLIDEGDLYSQQLWDTSILKLNQLGYFDPLKPEDAATITRDTKTNTVDLLLKVKERGKNSIQLNGGVSGISGSFIGFSYSTNNFLGLGRDPQPEQPDRNVARAVSPSASRSRICSISRSRLGSRSSISATATTRGSRHRFWPARI